VRPSQPPQRRVREGQAVQQPTARQPKVQLWRRERRLRSRPRSPRRARWHRSWRGLCQGLSPGASPLSPAVAPDPMHWAVIYEWDCAEHRRCSGNGLHGGGIWAKTAATFSAGSLPSRSPDGSFERLHAAKQFQVVYHDGDGSGSGGCWVRSITLQPFDVVKTRMQAAAVSGQSVRCAA
jgi:hypothetical protein